MSEKLVNPLVGTLISIIIIGIGLIIYGTKTKKILKFFKPQYIIWKKNIKERKKLDKEIERGSFYRYLFGFLYFQFLSIILFSVVLFTGDFNINWLFFISLATIFSIIALHSTLRRVSLTKKFIINNIEGFLSFILMHPLFVFYSILFNPKNDFQSFFNIFTLPTTFFEENPLINIFFQNILPFLLIPFIIFLVRFLISFKSRDYGIKKEKGLIRVLVQEIVSAHFWLFILFLPFIDSGNIWGSRVLLILYTIALLWMILYLYFKTFKNMSLLEAIALTIINFAGIVFSIYFLFFHFPFGSIIIQKFIIFVVLTFIVVINYLIRTLTLFEKKLIDKNVLSTTEYNKLLPTNIKNGALVFLEGEFYRG